ncbi:hypothetical protein [Celeribacter neptunius]|uniref:Extracellular repeat, HAF family n=1 Tax=Celeribacter neptunius TaxID=588602 RepID=A0A1I3SGL0_9RHOB|nr:hypothetical protein [Celeribacter neptunius]SFJ56567.1 hypothetical protein SAMN04487991_2422 [Celeribacter neptunius]
MTRLLTIVLLNTVATAALALPQSPSADLAGEAPLVNNDQDFVWSPTAGFAPVTLTSDITGSATFVGFAGTDTPGKEFRWDPDLGLVPASYKPGSGLASPLQWSTYGKEARVVVWNAEDLQALVADMALPEGVTVTAVRDVNPAGQTLLEARVGDSGESAFFLWTKGAPVQRLEPEDGSKLISVGALSDRGDVIGQVAQPGAPDMAAILLSDGSVRVLPGLDGNGSRATGLNDAGQVVGASADDPAKAVLWGPDGQSVALAEKLSAPLPDGFTLLDAEDINNAGEIVGTAVSGTGAVHLVTLTPDPDAGGLYMPKVIGEVFASVPDVTEQPRFALSENGTIFGTCSFGALDCPTNEFAFNGLGSDITNLFNPLNPASINGFQPFVTGAFLSATGAGAAGGGTGATGTPGIARQRPVFGPPTFPTVSTTGATTTTTGTTNTVPLPAANVLLLLALSLMAGVSALASGWRKRSFHSF